MQNSSKYNFRYYWHELFELGVALKAFNGVWETISGSLFLFLNKAVFVRLFYALAHRELLEDPHDRFINFLALNLQNLSSNTKVFASLYILFHGLLNLFLAIQLYRNKHWAYLVTVGVMVLFIIYQLHRYQLHHSNFLLIISIVDIGFILVTLQEYRYQTGKVLNK